MVIAFSGALAATAVLAGFVFVTEVRFRLMEAFSRPVLMQTQALRHKPYGSRGMRGGLAGTSQRHGL